MKMWAGDFDYYDRSVKQWGYPDYLAYRIRYKSCSVLWVWKGKAKKSGNWLRVDLYSLMT